MSKATSTHSLSKRKHKSRAHHNSESWLSNNDSEVDQDPYGQYDTTSSVYQDQMTLNNPIYDEEIEPNVIETYAGEWVEDRREGLGVCERTDGFRYEGEWMNNRRHGYGRTSFPDGSTEEGKYRFNILMPPPKHHKWLKVNANKYQEKLANALDKCVKIADNCQAKARIARERTKHSVIKSEQAEQHSALARDEASIARCVCKELAPEYKQIGLIYGRRGDAYDPVERTGLNTNKNIFLSDDDKLIENRPDYDTNSQYYDTTPLQNVADNMNHLNALAAAAAQSNAGQPISQEHLAKIDKNTSKEMLIAQGFVFDPHTGEKLKSRSKASNNIGDDGNDYEVNDNSKGNFGQGDSPFYSQRDRLMSIGSLRRNVDH